MPQTLARILGLETNAPAERELYSVNREEEQVAALRASFLQSRGLRPEHRFLEIGCGNLRAGANIIRLLNPGNYYGIDSSSSLIAAGRRHLAAWSLSDRVPAGNLRATDNLSVHGFPLFDFGMAHHVFTHLPLSYLSRCLSAIKPTFYSGGRFYAAFVVAQPVLKSIRHWKHDVIKDAANDSFHFSVPEITAAAERAGWKTNWIAEWSHQRDQHIAEFTLAWRPDPSRVAPFPRIA